MGFVVQKPKEIDLDVKVQVPGGARHQFTIQVKYLSLKERRSFLEDAAAEDRQDMEVAKDLILGWRGVRAEDGSDLPFNVSNLETLMDIPYIYNGITQALMDEFLAVMRPALTMPSYLRKN